jgi:hypothetical protein
MRKFGDAIRKPRLPTIGEAIASGQVRHDYEPGETASRRVGRVSGSRVGGSVWSADSRAG